MNREEMKELIKEPGIPKKFNIDMLFRNYEHKERYLELVEKDVLDVADAYRETLFYILSSCDDLYYQADKLYDFKEERIIIEYDADLTSTTSRLVALAFELFTNRNIKEMNTVDIFDYLDSEFFNVAVNALRVRFRKMP